MRSGNSSLWGTICVLVICVFAGNLEANTLFSIDGHFSTVVVRAYAIDGNTLTNPVTISEEMFGAGPVGIATSEDLGLIFVTNEGSSIVTVFKSKTLEEVAEVDTLISNPAGIVADDVKGKIYIIRRDYPELYVYTWNETTETLDPNSEHDLIGVFKGAGIALDGDYLYVTDTTETVRCYNTGSWAHDDSNDITLPTDFTAYGMAVYNDGSGNRFGYFGGWWYDNRFIKVDLNNHDNKTIITPSEGEGNGVAGIATDPDTGLVYASIADCTNRVYDTSFNEVFSIETGVEPDVTGPGGAVVGRYVPPFDPNIWDDIDDCVSPQGGQITYTIVVSYEWNEEGDPNFEDFGSYTLEAQLPEAVDFDSADPSTDPNHGIYNYQEHTVTWNVYSETLDTFTLAVKCNRKVTASGTVKIDVEVEAYLGNQWHYDTDTIETNVCDCSNYGKIIYADVGADPCGDGTEWDKAFDDLQDALAVAWPCDEIWVANGTYRPTSEPYYPDTTFRLMDSLGIYGGFEGWEEERYERDWFDNNTILCGDPNSDDDYSKPLGERKTGDNVNYVVSSFGYVKTAALDGFKIRSGRNAGVYCEGSSFVIQHNKITANETGIQCEDMEQAVIKNNWIYRNLCGLNFDNPLDAVIVRNNTIANNEKRGIDLEDGVEPEIINCIFWGHPDANDLVGCSATYSRLQAVFGGTGNISDDPCFVDSSADDYLLTAVSTCIDKGDPNGNYGGERDIEKQFRVLNGNGENYNKRVDMGADEYCNQGSDNDADFNKDSIVNYIDFAKFRVAWLDGPGDPNWEDGKYDLNGDQIIVDVNDLVIFAEEWLWMTCEEMEDIPMMEMMMGMGGGMGRMMDMESVLISETATAKAVTEQQASEAQPQVELSIEEQIAQAKRSLNFWLREDVREGMEDKDLWLRIVTDLEEWLKELEDSQ